MQLVCFGGSVRSFYLDNQDVPAGDIVAGVSIVPWSGAHRMTDLALVGPAPAPGDPDTRLFAAPVLTAQADLVAYAATARYYKQVAGINYLNALVDTHPSEVSNVASLLQGVQAANQTSITYKALSGFVALTVQQLTAMLAAMNTHVQACFAGELQCQKGISANPATIGTTAQVDAVFGAITV